MLYWFYHFWFVNEGVNDDITIAAHDYNEALKDFNIMFPNAKITGHEIEM